MVHPNEILESLRTACKGADPIPESVTYATVELDADGDHADVPLPIIEFSIENIDRDTSRNTDKVGFELDADGNEIGYIYQGWFDMDLTVSIITASGGDANHRVLDKKLRQTLAVFDDRMIGNQLPDPDDPTVGLSGVSEFTVGQITPDHDFDTSPSVRGRNVSVQVDYVHDYFTTDLVGAYDYVEDIQNPDVTAD